MDEFIAAVKSTGAKPPASAASSNKGSNKGSMTTAKGSKPRDGVGDNGVAARAAAAEAAEADFENFVHNQMMMTSKDGPRQSGRKILRVSTPSSTTSPDAAARTLRALFAQADENGDGILQFDEFLELCAHQPWLVSAFDKIVEHGVRRKLRSEEARLSTIFRTPISPLSRMVMSPGGRGRFRPCMIDLRPVDEVGALLEEADNKKKHE